MDIAALGMSMSTSALHQKVGLAVMKMAMDTTAELGENMVNEMLKGAVPSLTGDKGNIIDVWA